MKSSSPKLHHSTSPRQRSPSTGFGALNNENPNYSGEERALDDVAVEFDKKQLLSSRAEGREDDDDSYLPFVIENAKTLVCKRVGPFYGRKEPGFDLESFVNSKAEADGEPPSKRLKNIGSNPFPKYSGDKKLVHFIQRYYNSNRCMLLLTVEAELVFDHFSTSFGLLCVYQPNRR